MNQLLACLRLYSTGGHLQQVADFMGMHISTACRIVKRVSEAIARLYGQHIVFPNGIEEIRTTQEDFFNVAAFLRVLGAIDGTHIRIQSPGNKSLFTLLLTYQRFSELLICCKLNGAM
jgi:hypothetical protein